MSRRDWMTRWLVVVLLVLAVAGITAPMAHVLELQNKMRLDGTQWLLVQKTLYLGWGPIFGAIDIATVVIAAATALIAQGAALRASLITVVCIYALMIVDFFVFNAPANAAFNSWTAQTLPSSWPGTRVQWETGHAIAAALSVAALAVVMRSALLAMNPSARIRERAT